MANNVRWDRFCSKTIGIKNYMVRIEEVNMFDDSYIQEINAAYWAEEDEMKAGTHPSQVKERIEKSLHEIGHEYREITFLDWNIEGSNVKVFIDGSLFGVFNYEENKFV